MKLQFQVVFQNIWRWWLWKHPDPTPRLLDCSYNKFISRLCWSKHLLNFRKSLQKPKWMKSSVHVCSFDLAHCDRINWCHLKASLPANGVTGAPVQFSTSSSSASGSSSIRSSSSSSSSLLLSFSLLFFSLSLRFCSDTSFFPFWPFLYTVKEKQRSDFPDYIHYILRWTWLNGKKNRKGQRSRWCTDPPKHL